jgi:thioredoxin reductase
MNRQFDIIVIGDSKEGNNTIKHIAAKKPTIKIAFISREFKSSTTHDFLNVEYIKGEVTFTDYRNRLFGCYLASGERFYCTHLIVASGLKYEPYKIGNKQVPCVYNTTNDIPNNARTQPALVIANSDKEVKFAMSVAKKYKQIYLCTTAIELKAQPSTLKKLDATKNIVVLPNTSILRVFTSDEVLNKVELDNYSTITCSAIYVKTTTTPETSFVSANLILKNEEQYLDTMANLESSLVPKCFAVGNCAKKSTKKMISNMYETILNDF